MREKKERKKNHVPFSTNSPSAIRSAPSMPVETGENVDGTHHVIRGAGYLVKVLTQSGCHRLSGPLLKYLV